MFVAERYSERLRLVVPASGPAQDPAVSGAVRKLFLAIVLLAAGLLVVVGMPLYATETENGWEKCRNGAPEGTEALVDGWSWWPVGTRCVLIERDGTRHEEVVPPWRGDPWSDEDL